MHSILIEFGIPMKLVMLIKMCPNETCSRVQVGKYLSEMFPLKKEGDALSPLLFTFVLEYAVRRVQEKLGWTEVKWYISSSDLC